MTRLTLRPYQKADVLRGLDEFEGRVMLKHTQGLGKSLCATRICEESEGVPLGPVVVICRTHLILQWIRHIRSEYPNARIASVVEKENGRWREMTKPEKEAMLRERPPYDFYVLTFASIRRVKKADKQEAAGERTQKQIWADVAEGHGWVEQKKPKREPYEYPLPPCRSLIVDESHVLRECHSQQYAGAYRLATPTKSRKAAERVVLISTTPAWREQDNLFAPLRLLDARKFRSYWEFVGRYCILEESEYGSKVVGGRTKRIARLLEHYAITRDYSDPDVAMAVPKIVPEEVTVWLSPSGERAYKKLEDDLSRDRDNGFSVGSGVSSFFAITATDREKLAALDTIVESFDGEPYAVLCLWQSTLELLGGHLGLSIFSGKSGGNRFNRVDAIKESGSFVATIGSVQEGANLSHLRNVVFYECAYTHGAMDQIRTRFARWRQDNSTDPVRCVYLICAGSVDEIAYERSMQRGATEREILDEIKRRKE